MAVEKKVVHFDQRNLRTRLTDALPRALRRVIRPDPPRLTIVPRDGRRFIAPVQDDTTPPSIA